MESISSSKRVTGCVKWFNSKTGYGFISVTDGSKSGTDVFVHHTSINAVSNQYKYLVQGEYVEFSFTDAKNNNNEFQAGYVSGINGGKLMCETRNEHKSFSRNYINQKTDLVELSDTVQKKIPDFILRTSIPRPNNVESRVQMFCSGVYTNASVGELNSAPVKNTGGRGSSGRGSSEIRS